MLNLVSLWCTWGANPETVSTEWGSESTGGDRQLKNYLRMWRVNRNGWRPRRGPDKCVCASRGFGLGEAGRSCRSHCPATEPPGPWGVPGPLRRTPALAGPPMASRSPARRVQGRPRAMCVPRPGAVAAPARPVSPGETPKPSVHTPAKSKGGGRGDERHGGPGGGLCCFPTGPSTLGKESPAAPTPEWPSSCDGSRMTCRQGLACDRVSAWGWGAPGPDTEGSSGGTRGGVWRQPAATP